MKKILLLSIILMNLIAINATAQCEKTYSLCVKQLSKEDQKAGWLKNRQSEISSISVEKGSTYEVELTAYKNFEYRLSVCTDIAGGTDAKFQLAREASVAVTDSTGATSFQKKRTIIFDNTIADNTELYVLFTSNKTEKFHLTVQIPSVGKSKKLGSSEFVCVGVLLEERRLKKSSF